MSYVAPSDPNALASADFHCRLCSWFGKGAQALAELNTVVRCPKCDAPVHNGLPPAGIESGWDFEQGALAKFGIDGHGFWLIFGPKLPACWSERYEGWAIPLKEAAGFARRILRVLELAGYQEEAGHQQERKAA